MRDIAHLLRPAHLQQLRNILDDPEASDNDRFVALDLLKNANIAAGGVLPMCQDTGTAIIKAKKGQFVLTGGGDEAAIARGVYNTYLTSNLRYSQMAPLTMYEEKNTGNNLPAEIKIAAVDGDAYKFLFIAKGGGSANKSYLFQETKALLNEKTLLPWLFDKMKTLGTSACPPYHLAVVIGGTSAEFAVETAKLASTKYLDGLPTDWLDRRVTRFRDIELEAKVLALSQQTASAPSSAASTSATTCASSGCRATAPVARWRWLCRAAPTARRSARSPRDGVFLEQLETDPAHFLPDVVDEHLDGESVAIDLNRPMDEIRAELSRYPVKTRVMLTGPMVVARDIAHAKLKERLDEGLGLPQYMHDYCVYYAGPGQDARGHGQRLVRPDDRRSDGQLRRRVPGSRRELRDARQGQPQPAGHRGLQDVRRLLPRLDRRPRGTAGAGLHHQGRGARVRRARDGGDLEDRGPRLPGVHRRRRQGQRLLRAGRPPARRHRRRGALMDDTRRPRFHLAMPVDDLDEAAALLGRTLGCPRAVRRHGSTGTYAVTRSSPISRRRRRAGSDNPVDGHDSAGTALRIDPLRRRVPRPRRSTARRRHEVRDRTVHPRFAGEAGEQWTMFFYDPAGNALEFKAFADEAQIFAV